MRTNERDRKVPHAQVFEKDGYKYIRRGHARPILQQVICLISTYKWKINNFKNGLYNIDDNKQ